MLSQSEQRCRRWSEIVQYFTDLTLLKIRIFSNQSIIFLVLKKTEPTFDRQTFNLMQKTLAKYKKKSTNFSNLRE